MENLGGRWIRPGKAFKPLNIAIIGAGWAGLSAAVQLHKLAHNVTVIEASRTLGGRARRVKSPTISTTLDNGQHILLGAYSATLSLMQDLHLSPEITLLRERLQLQSADGQFSLRAPALPAPLHLLIAVLTARGLSLKEKFALMQLTHQLQRKDWQVTPGLTVAMWLSQGGQSDNLIRQFWQPLCLAAMNTPIVLACAQLFANVLKDSLGADRFASDTLIPKVDLSTLWPDHVATLSKNMAVRTGQLVRHLATQGNAVQVDDETFDAVIMACNIPSTQRLLAKLPDTPESSLYLQQLAQFDYLPIATVTFQLAKPWNLPKTMFMLNEHPERLHFGQWLFDRSVFITPTNAAPETTLSVVISDASQLMVYPREQVIQAIKQQIDEQTLRFRPMPEIIATELIIEKKASFAAVPGLFRPDCTTPWKGIYAAGDWTNTGYPGVLEGAVRSGQEAANVLHNTLR